MFFFLLWNCTHAKLGCLILNWQFLWKSMWHWMTYNGWYTIKTNQPTNKTFIMFYCTSIKLYDMTKMCDHDDMRQMIWWAVVTPMNFKNYLIIGWVWVSSCVRVETKLGSTEPFGATTRGGWLCVAASLTLFIDPYMFSLSLSLSLSLFLSRSSMIPGKLHAVWIMKHLRICNGWVSRLCKSVTTINVRDSAIVIHCSHSVLW